MEKHVGESTADVEEEVADVEEELAEKEDKEVANCEKEEESPSQGSYIDLMHITL